MFYSLYDSSFNALGKRKTYPCSSWKLRRKSNDFDELTLEGLAIENSDGAMYVGIHENDGTLKYLALSGIPETINGKTKINAIDIRQLLNNDAIIDLTDPVGNSITLIDIYNRLLTSIFVQYENMGVITLTPALHEIEAGDITVRPNTIDKAKGKGNVWKTLQGVNSIYDCYVDFNWDLLSVILTEKKIQFRVRRLSELINIKLEDFGSTKIKKDYTGVNRIACFQEGNNYPSIIYYLLNDDTVVAESDIADEAKIIYPAVIEIMEDVNLEKAKTNAIKKLYSNRFKANIELNLENNLGYLFRNADLNTMVDIYGYKRLPIKEIYEDSSNKKTVKFGRMEEYFWAI